jgi:type IV fimbrial biogenesis protein FimT
MAFLYRRDRSLRGLKAERGFTLIEVVVTLAIVAIAAGLAIPMFRDVIRNTTVSGETNDFITALATARSEAVRRGTDVAVISNGPPGSSEWTTGWQVIADSDRNGSFDEVVTTTPALNPTYRIYVNDTNGGVDNQIVFRMNGSLTTVGGFDVNVCFPGGDAAKSRRIRVRPSGNVSSHKNTAGSSALTCPGS